MKNPSVLCPLAPFPICTTTLVLRTYNHGVAPSGPLRETGRGRPRFTECHHPAKRWSDKEEGFYKGKTIFHLSVANMETEQNQPGRYHLLTSPTWVSQSTVCFQNRPTWLIYMWWQPRSLWSHIHLQETSVIFRAVRAVCLWYFQTNSFLVLQKWAKFKLDFVTWGDLKELHH